MAKKNTSQSTSSTETNAFNGGMQKDMFASYEPKESWSHAINAANNSVDGDIGVIGNEPANLQCAVIPYTIIGAIHMYGDQWIIFSTDDESSEIGVFDDSKCEYKTLVNDPCLNFNRKYLVTGAAKENYDCTWQVYWDDSNNPSRTLNIDDIPYVQEVVSAPGADCILYEDTSVLDCEKIRLAPLVDIPCVKLKKNIDGGQLRNGSYQAYIAYVLNDQRVTDYIGISNLQALFYHKTNAGSLDIEVTNLDKGFEYFELVILSDNQGLKSATKIGKYSTEQSKISIDFIDPSLPAVGLNLLFLKSPAYEKSESMYVVNDYLIRQGPSEQFDFNYQPLANKIKSNWVVAEYDSRYYFEGGNKTQFMRDEVYAFFIRWIYNTGEKSASYHIPGRAPSFNAEDQFGASIAEIAPAGTNINAIGTNDLNFQIYNTATEDPTILSTLTDDGGVIIRKGEMAYWQSTERYPATKPEIWNSTYIDPETGVNIGDTANLDYDLCGKEIRHHKFPTEETGVSLRLSADSGGKIRILGVEFSNIERPKNNDGTYIENIIGYEILRGSRENAKSILAKGLFRNMRGYEIPDGEGNLGPTVGLYPNYPYNDLTPDVYHHTGDTANSSSDGLGDLWQVDPLPRTDGCFNNWQQTLDDYPPLPDYRTDIFTFHSPELMFRRPFLNPYEIRLYGAYSGESVGQFIASEKHPKNKLLRNGAVLVAGILGIGYALAQMQGTRSTRLKTAENINAPWMPLITPPTPFNPAGVNIFAAANQTTVATTYNLLALALQEGIDDVAALTDLIAGGGNAQTAAILIEALEQQTLGITPGYAGGGLETTYNKDSDTSLLPAVVKLIFQNMNTVTHVTIGAQKIIDLLYNLISKENYAFKFNSHGLFSKYHKTKDDEIFRTKNIQANYIGSSFQVFNTNFKINNLNRPDTVVIQAAKALPKPNDLNAPQDRSRYCLGGDAFSGLLPALDYGRKWIVNPGASQARKISALYGALKFNFDNQYGQLENVKQVQMNGCTFEIDLTAPDRTKYSTTSIFSGDTYVGRYTEKVIMPIFTDFLYGQPDEFTYNYLQRINIPYPRFWMDTRKYDTSRIADKLLSLGFNTFSNTMPNDLYYLDRGDGTCNTGISSILLNRGSGLFALRYGYLYTHVNGILDFFTESELNLPNRDWEDTPEGRYYDPNRTAVVTDLFDAGIIKEDNVYKYDYSLSASRFVTNLTSSGLVQPRDYNPKIAETCYTFYPKRLIYSLQAQEEAKKDFWKVFLANNYKDFKNPVNVIKPINKSGAIIFFPYQSPQMFQGIDQLQTDLGTKLTIGDGGLFSQPFQNLVNSDLENEYGSCESQRGIRNTPFGFFFISQAQGKIFQQSGQSLTAISNQGMKWWFNKYLPSSLIKQFPELEFSKLGDNPVIGVGCQVAYDVTDDIVYFCKKDFKLKEEWENQIVFDPEEDCFVISGGILNPPDDSKSTIAESLLKSSLMYVCPDCDTLVYGFADGITSFDANDQQGCFDAAEKGCGEVLPSVPKICVDIGDPLYFDDCSWTVSYDPKSQAWISFHDWHPELNLSSINHFLTTQTGITDTPQCPPGYVYNNLTQDCEILVDETFPAVVSIDELPSVINSFGGNCTYDIVFAVDSSGSTGSPVGGLGGTMVNFVTDFLNNPSIVGLMASGNVQIGITSWANNTQQKSMNPNGFSMSNTIGPLDVYNWFTLPCIAGPGNCGSNSNYENWWNGGTDVESAFNYSQTILQNRAGSELGDRSGDPNYKSILIMVPDGHSTSPVTVLPPYYGCNYQSPLLGGSAPNDWQYVYSVFATTDPIKDQNNIPTIYAANGLPPFDPADATSYGQSENRKITCNVFENMLAVSSDPDPVYAQLLELVINVIVSDICDNSTTCDCPEGYTLAYFDEQTQDFTSPTGSCTSGETPQPICRKVECLCPPSSNSNAIGTQTGECDNVYLAGTVDYVNPDPLFCHYFLEDSVPANLKIGGIWRHNYRCDLFANYYDVDYPWEVELIENTGQNVNTVRSVEYQLESYVYKGDQFNACGDDRWHDLDFNFDEAIIYNTEQVSGLLRLELSPKEDPLNMLTYPIINTSDIQILYSKIEQKYRFNQFWDVTNDRGEFTNAEENILITQCNGYIRELNSLNLNYNKSEDQRKKFRHYYNKVLLRRTLSNNRKMLLKLNNSKLNLSFR